MYHMQFNINRLWFGGFDNNLFSFFSSFFQSEGKSRTAACPMWSKTSDSVQTKFNKYIMAKEKEYRVVIHSSRDVNAKMHILMNHNNVKLSNLTKLSNEHRHLVYLLFHFSRGLNSDQQVCNHVEKYKFMIHNDLKP